MKYASDDFVNAMNNEYYRKILNKVCYKNLKAVCSKDEIKSFIMYTMWHCVSKFDKTKGTAKFSSYLYTSALNNSARLYKKKKKALELREFNDNIHLIRQFEKQSAQREVFEIMESLEDINPEYRKILEQKFLLGMTNKEIGKMNGYCKEAARKKVHKALKVAREIVYNSSEE